METEIFSKGLYSTWLYIPEIKTGFDAGDGMSTSLGQRSLNLDRILLSHDHVDHISGLLSLVSLRQVARGDNDRPLTVFYPPKSEYMGDIRALVNKFCQNRRFELKWCEIEPDMEIPTETPRKVVRCFPVEHGKYSQGKTFGFSILEDRDRLIKALQGKPPEEIKKAKLEGKTIRETYRKILWVYSGDAMPIPVKECLGADTLIHDCTFLDENDRDKGSRSHATLPELYNLCRAAQPKNVWASHISPRYMDMNFERNWVEKVRKQGIELVWPGRKVIINKARDRNKPLSKCQPSAEFSPTPG